MDQDFAQSRTADVAAAPAMMTPPGMVAPERLRRVILIVGPEDRLSMLDTTALRTAGFDVTSALDPTPLLQSSAPPDLILMPVTTSTDDVLAECRRIRNVAPTALPIVVVTRFDDPYLREQIVRSGATAILVEPLKHSFVLRQLRRLVARSMLHRPR